MSNPWWSQDAGIIVVVVVLVLILSTTVIFSLFYDGSRLKKGGGKPTFLVVGPCGSGKTGLYVRLRYKNDVAPETVMSSSINEYNDYQVIGKEGQGISRTIIDTPGHAKLRSIVYELVAHKRVAGIIFVVDSSAIKPNQESSSDSATRSTAEYLIEIILRTESNSTSKKIPLLIACNKSDLFTALPPFRIKKLLQDEIEIIKRSKTKQLFQNNNDHQKNNIDIKEIQQDEIEQDNLKLGGDVPFNFDLLESTTVSLLSGSVTANKIELWTDWIKTNV